MPRAPKKCGNTGCTERVTGRIYCDAHQAEWQARRNTTERGYGAPHQAARKVALETFEDGQLCGRCGLPMHDNDELELDHDDIDRSKYRGLAHARCNSRAGGQKARGGTPYPPPDF